MTLSEKFRHNLHLILFLVLTGLYLFQSYSISNTYNLSNKVINEDALGYYIVLPALFHYNDLNFEFIDTVLKKTDTYRNYLPPIVNILENGDIVAKYYSGVALLQSPFFLITYFSSSDRKTETCFEEKYHSSIRISAMFYVVFACILLAITLQNIGINKIWSSLLPWLMIFGTNLFAYSTYDLAYSHSYSFFALNLFLYALIQLKKSYNKRFLILSGLAYGLILIIRPLNGISILFIGVIFNSKEFFEFFKKPNIKGILIGFISLLSILSIQSILWYLQTGKLYVYPYGVEKLHLLNPQIYDLVFSYNCGWAVYTPLAFILLIASLLALILQRKIKQAIWTFSISFLIIYLLSCWYYLHYGCTIGCRPITEFYGPLCLIFGYSFRPYFQSKLFKIIGIPFLFILLWYNQIIHTQFFENIINWCDMDKKRFQMVFLKTDPIYRYSCSPFYNYSKYDNNLSFINKKIDKIFSIHSNVSKDTITYFFNEWKTNDSTLLINIKFKALIKDYINESFFRILLTDNGVYKDLHYVLLKRILEQTDSVTEFTYQFHLNESVLKPILHLSLETNKDPDESELLLESIEVKRVKF